jgi:hypothetical protein
LGHLPFVPAFSSLIFNTDSQPVHVYRMVIKVALSQRDTKNLQDADSFEMKSLICSY